MVDMSRVTWKNLADAMLPRMPLQRNRALRVATRCLDDPAGSRLARNKNGTRAG